MSRSTFRHGADPDSSVLIAAERKGQTARQVLLDIGSQVGGEGVAVSVVTLIELAHGVARAETQQRREVRQQFIDELMIALPVHSVLVSVALRAGRIDGELAVQGFCSHLPIF